MIFDIVPGNILSPFVEGNTLQIIFLASVFGIAMLFLERKTAAVAKATEQLNQIVQFIIEVISKLIPPFVFIVITSMIWSETAGVLLSIGKLFLILFIVAFIIAIATPPIPGGSVIAYSMLVSIMDFPEEALVIAFASDAIFDFIVTGFDQFMLPFALLNLSTRMGLTDRTILMKNDK